MAHSKMPTPKKLGSNVIKTNTILCGRGNIKPLLIINFILLAILCHDN